MLIVKIAFIDHKSHKLYFDEVVGDNSFAATAKSLNQTEGIGFNVKTCSAATNSY